MMNVSQIASGKWNFWGASEILMLLARQGKWLKTLYYTTDSIYFFYRRVTT